GSRPRSARIQRSFNARMSLWTCSSVVTSMSACGVSTPCSIDSMPTRCARTWCTDQPGRSGGGCHCASVSPPPSAVRSSHSAHGPSRISVLSSALRLTGANVTRAARARAAGSAESAHALGTAAERAGDLPLRVPFGQVLTLVVGLLTAGQRQLHLDLALAEVQRERHQRQVAVAQLAGQLIDLAAVQQQLAV